MLRGLIGSREELESKLETFRLHLLRTSMAEEMEIQYQRDTMMALGPFEQESGGKIRAGALTEIRQKAYTDLLRRTHPFEQWDQPGPEESKKTEEQDRLDFVTQYKNWAEKGGEVVASHIQYSGDSSSR